MNFTNLVSKYLVVFSLGLIFLCPASTHAFQQLQLEVEGELMITPAFNPPNDPPLEAVFGLQDGDLFNFTIRFDSAIDTNGFIDVDSIDVQLGNLNFANTAPVNAMLSASGTPFSFRLFDFFIEETGQDDISLAAITAVPLFFTVVAEDLEANPNLFPADFSTADVTNFESGFLGLTDSNGGSSNALQINFTGLSVTAVPEPTAGIVLTLATLVLTRRRRC